MDFQNNKNLWLSEEKMTFKGWDFSYLANRISEQELPWDYKSIVTSYMNNTRTMLDMGTGGGEFLVSLHPPRNRTFATEAYPPNYELCRKKLPDYGIEVRQVFSDEELPFENSFFDLIINRHEAFCASEVYRILKPGGLFVTQQVGGQNNRELSRFLLETESKRIEADFHLRSAADDLKLALRFWTRRKVFQCLRFMILGRWSILPKLLNGSFLIFL
ncbi:class I SAM-dependent methyltransferase [Brevibacillus ginsengisoli]|uniref:class I SAM-dependent methyltransferase n=1 Tax=Brevibacillus ginsengisoli TaxID=363854 RepID=UPI003CFB5B02